ISRRAGPEPPHRSADEFPGEPTFYLAGIGDHDAKEVHMTKFLEGKTAIIYGGGGGIGSGVARGFARGGAGVFLAGRTRGKLDAVAQDIASDGESAEVAVLDALDEPAVEEHVRAVASKAGGVDVSFNLIARGDVQGTPLVDMTTDDLLRAVVT